MKCRTRREISGFFMKNDEKYMKRAVKLGWKGTNLTSPNPRVGCVIVKNGKIIGEGYHKAFGGKHAEIEAVESANASLKGSAVYVTLEPCSHYGKTPPCSERLVKEGIKEVVIGVKDPDPEIKGIELLRENGIKVRTGILEKECGELTGNYLTFVLRKRPHVTAKAALSLDGKIASVSGRSRWISGETARNYTMKLRGLCDSILVGAGTVNADNPQLTYRLKHPAARNPLRIVLDGRLRLKTASKIIGENTVVFSSEEACGKNPEKVKSIIDKGAKVVKVKTRRGRINSSEILKYLYLEGKTSLLIEGGGETIGNFIEDRLLDRIIYIYAPIVIGGRKAPSACGGKGIAELENCPKVKNVVRKKLGEDLLIQGDIEYVYGNC